MERAFRRARSMTVVVIVERKGGGPGELLALETQVRRCLAWMGPRVRVKVGDSDQISRSLSGLRALA